jgi:hypothetical protein
MSLSVRTVMDAHGDDFITKCATLCVEFRPFERTAQHSTVLYNANTVCTTAHSCVQYGHWIRLSVKVGDSLQKGVARQTNAKRTVM